MLKATCVNRVCVPISAHLDIGTVCLVPVCLKLWSPSVWPLRSLSWDAPSPAGEILEEDTNHSTDY